MEIIKGNLLDITEGVIVHQVNCQNAIGAGLSGQIIKRYPEVGRAYHSVFAKQSREQIFGQWQPVKVSDSLIVVNSFTQFRYGNALKNKKIYTDSDKLVEVLNDICHSYPGVKIYVPERIGCGLAGGNWDDLLKRLKELPIIVVSLQ